MPPNDVPTDSAAFLDWIVANVGQAAEGLPSGLYVPQSEQAYHAGTTAPLIGVPMLTPPGAIAVPASSVASASDYWSLFLSLREYGPDTTVLGPAEDAAIEAFGRQLIGGIGREEMINQLCGLGAAMIRPEIIQLLREGLEASISPACRERLAAALMASPPYQFLARQPVLVALARTFIDDGQNLGAGIGPVRPDVAALMLSHAVGAGLKWADTPPGGPTIGGHPEHIAADLVCNQTLYGSDDLVGVLDRTLRLWREYGSVGAQRLGGRHPARLLESITGLELEDFLALGFALYLHRLNWVPGGPARLADTFGSGMDEHKRTTFLDYVARTPEAMTDRLRSSPPRTGWDLMAFVETPVLHYPSEDDSPGGLVVIDLAFLLEKITVGLYWLVHDYLRDNESDLARQSWTQAWGDMVEAMVEDNLRGHVPVILGGQSALYTEHDLHASYPGHKTSDVVIDCGDVVMAIEIGSGRPSVDTVRGGNPDALRRDLERLAFKKIRQLDDTARCLTEAPEKLIGSVTPIRPVQPVLVAAGGFFMSPVTANAIAEYCATNGFLTHALVRTPAVITMDEVEMLEGLAEHRGISMPALLQGWKSSPLKDVSLRNYLLDRFGTHIMDYRPSRMRPRFDRLSEDMIARLNPLDPTEEMSSQLVPGHSVPT